MEVESYIKKKKQFYTLLMEYIECEQDDDSAFHNLSLQLNYKVNNQFNKNDFYLTLQTISCICEKYHRNDFFDKIERIILLFKNDIKKIENSEIFEIFKNNKNLRIFMFENDMIHYDNDLDLNFKNRENESYICQLIRNDSVEDFIIYVNRLIIPLTSKIKLSNFETNSFLIKNNPTLIEYAAFFGSKQIFLFLLNAYVERNYELNPKLWIYGIHSNNADIIHLLEDYHIKINILECIEESIKCHHNNIANYLISNHNYEDKMPIFFVFALKYKNYEFFPDTITTITFEVFSNLYSMKFLELATKIVKTKEIQFHVPNGVIIHNQIDDKDMIQLLLDYDRIDLSNIKECDSLTEIQIPSFVKEIPSNTFQNCKNLSAITFKYPSQTRKINRYAFNGLSILEINIPSSVTFIDKFAFSKCKSLIKINIPFTLNTINMGTFSDCLNLQEICIPNSVTSIQKCAFENCSSLKKILIPSSVTFIDKFAFQGCSSLKTVEINGPLKSIENKVFFMCNKLTNISIPSTVIMINSYAFSECCALKEIKIPDSVEFVGSHAFSRCYSLSKISISSSLKEINDYTFNECTNLIDIDIPRSVTLIGKYAFNECKCLTQIILPSSIKKIDDFAFNECISLSKIIFPKSIVSVGSYSFNN